MALSVRKIISCGQTGADRAASDVAVELGIEHGGYVPQGRRAEDGQLDPKDQVEETTSARPEVRTAANVRVSDGTLILSHGPLTGGSALTLAIAQRKGKPALQVDLGATSTTDAVAQIREWLTNCQPKVLAVTGPRASSSGRIYEKSKGALRAVFHSNGAKADGSTDCTP